VGPVEIETGRDRNGTFESGLVKKRNDLGQHVSVQYHGMYGLGMSVRDISSHLKEMYDANIRTPH
jgi:putative transposase